MNVLILLLFFLQPSICVQFFCFTNNLLDGDLLLKNLPNCTHLVVNDFVKIDNENFEYDLAVRYKANYLRISAAPYNIKLLAEVVPKKGNSMTIPIGIHRNKTFLKNFKIALRHLRSLNPLNAQPLFAGIFFRAEAFQKEQEYYGFFDMLNKMREKNRVGQIALEISSNFQPYTIGFPANKVINEIIDIFYLQVMASEVFAEMEQNNMEIAISTVQIDPIFVSKSANPKFSLIFQKDLLDKFKITNKTVVGFSTVGYEMPNSESALVKKISMPTICSILNATNQSIQYDTQSFTTAFVHNRSFAIFNMPYHKSLKEKIRWISQNDFLGVGLSSLEDDLDQKKMCPFRKLFPLHDYFSKLISALGAEKKQRELLAKMSIESWQMARMRDDETPINADVHQVGTLPIKAVEETEEFYGNQNEKVFNSNVTEESSGIANFMEKIGVCNELCGVADDLFIDKDEFRTIGGEVLRENYYPWVVFVRVHLQCTHSPTIFMHCTGVLVSMKHVITAAHCMFINSTILNQCFGRQRYFPNIWVKTDVENVFVHFGSISMSTTQIAKIRKISTDSGDFDMFNEDTLRINDYAILELCRTLDRKTDNVVPICLIADSHYGERMGEIAIVAGYGGDYYDISNFWNKSQSVTYVPVKSAAYCDNFYNKRKNWNYQRQKFVCAGGTNKGFTYGDCGGPLMVERNGLYYLIGIVMSSSASAPEYKKILPDVYTRVNTLDTCSKFSRVTNNQLKCLDEVIPFETLAKNCEAEHAKLLDKTYQRTCEYETDQFGRCRWPIGPFHTHIFP